ncbi:peptidase A8 [Rhodopirellula sp. MGV]|nr:peptidase A8 [Rhodopirellula sp. MGV]PNY33831.1 signal peptidase II [Rhodopirellula baltica]
MPDQSHPEDAARPVSLVSRAIVFAGLAITGGVIDLWSKQVIFNWRGLPGEKDIWWVWEPFFGIETAVNIGAVFGIGAGQGTLFATASVIAAVGIVAWLFLFRAAESLWLTVALGLVGGGIIGNLYDRVGMWWEPGYPDVWKSGVRDWILWRINERWTWPNFNIADSLLVVGACMLLYQSIFLQPSPLSQAKHSESGSPDSRSPESDAAGDELAST